MTLRGTRGSDPPERKEGALEVGQSPESGGGTHVTILLP